MVNFLCVCFSSTLRYNRQYDAMQAEYLRVIEAVSVVNVTQNKFLNKIKHNTAGHGSNISMSI